MNANNRRFKPIRLISDQAVAELESGREDSLGFAPYAQVISQVVRGTRGPFTIGVFGEWGMGKTSLMRMIEHEVTSSGDDTLIIPVWFNAWMFENVDYPIIPLIKGITEQLREYETAGQATARKLRGLVDILESLAAAFKLKGTLGSTSGIASAELALDPARLMSTYSRLRNRRLNGTIKKDPYQEIFEALDMISEKSVPKNVTILVLVDDLDRCFPENAIKLLESIKLILAQPGFIFVLGASRVVIEEYLQSKYEKQYGIAHFDGRAYIDKMIQLSFDIPPHAERINAFTKNLINTLDDVSIRKDLRPISKIIGAICQYNPRTIIRFVNRLITDAAIYRQLSSNPIQYEMPIGVFAVSRSLQYNWKDFYGLLISGDVQEDREYCSLVAAWDGPSLLAWKDYESLKESNNDYIVRTIKKIKNADPEVLQDIAKALSRDRALQVLIDGKIGRQWLKNHAERETSISFLTSQQSTEEVVGQENKEINDTVDSWKDSRPTLQLASHDDIYMDAIRVVIDNKKASTSLLQRRLRIGYGRAARIIEELESYGIIGPSDGARPREVLVTTFEEAESVRIAQDADKHT